MIEKVFSLGELFSGPGGMALGALNTEVISNNQIFKIEHKWANDIDRDSCQTYAHNLLDNNSQSVICEDVRKLDINKLTKIDAFAYGFPCNDFSNIGERKGLGGTYGPLYTYGIQILNKFKPKFFVAENVGGIRSANEGKAFEKILSDLEKAGNGYNLTINLYKAEEYGVPQIRRRIIIVGIDKSLNILYKVPKPTTKDKILSVRKAIEVPPITKESFNNEYTNQSSLVVERLKHIKPGENVWNSNLPKHLRLNVKNAKLSQIYKRLDPEKPSYTITGSGGGGTHGYHWTENRALTNRERARIQTFPDKFKFLGSKESVRKQIGMAVPPQLAKVIFESILKTFAKIDYEYVEENIKRENSLSSESTELIIKTIAV